MAKIGSAVGPSSADVAKETTDLIHKGKIPPGDTQLLEWKTWKASLCGNAVVVRRPGSPGILIFVRTVSPRGLCQSLKVKIRVILRKILCQRLNRRPKQERSPEMPRASTSGFSNAAAGERFEYAKQEEAMMDQTLIVESDGPEDEGESPSAGTSSSTSESKQDKSGSSSGTDPQSPAPETDSHSSEAQPQNQESSTVHSTDGNTPETSSDRASQPDSSADSAQREQATAPETRVAPKSRAKRAGAQ